MGIRRTARKSPGRKPAKNRSEATSANIGVLGDRGPELLAGASPEIEEAAWTAVEKRGASYVIGARDHEFDLQRHFREMAAHYKFDTNEMVLHLNVPPVGEDPIDTAAEITAQRLVELELMYQAGVSHAPLCAIQEAISYGIPLPLWAANAVSDAIQAWSSAAVKTLDEAFGVRRPKNWDQTAARNRHMRADAVVDQVDQLRRTKPLAEELFEEVGEQFNVNPATVKRWYYAYRRSR